jgi:hypothetical protein
VLPLSFRILEQNDGAVLQIIYSGKPEARLAVAGAVVGAGTPKEVFSQQRPPIDRRQFSKIVLVIGASATAASVFLLLVVALLFLHRRETLRQRSAAFVLGLTISQIIAFGVFAYLHHRESQPVVPPTIWMNQ